MPVIKIVVAVKYKVVLAKAQGVSGIIIPPVAPHQKVCDYRLEDPLRSLKNEQGMSMQREVCLLPQLGGSTQGAYDVANVVMC